ncbi:MAG TPA: hypothetical protein VJC04_00790 [Candidatus Paceibacterota bacterium]
MSEVEFFGENESNTRFVPRQSQSQQGQMGGRGMTGLIMHWFKIANETVASYILVAIAIIFFATAMYLFFKA